MEASLTKKHVNLPLKTIEPRHQRGALVIVYLLRNPHSLKTETTAAGVLPDNTRACPVNAAIKILNSPELTPDRDISGSHHSSICLRQNSDSGF